MAQDQDQHLAALISALSNLSTNQIKWVAGVVEQFGKSKRFTRNYASTFVSQQLLDALGYSLCIHHCFSREPFSKDIFEYALERVANDCGLSAQLAPRGNAGYDITISGQRFSLKTEASAKINVNKIHISKFMELGGGDWGNDPQHLLGLRDQFFEHLTQYERIFVLRKLPETHEGLRYELVEIPKSLMLEAESGVFEMKTESTQSGAKPGYCYVKDEAGNLKYSLYFDGGGERKLQIKAINKALCEVHAEWNFIV